MEKILCTILFLMPMSLSWCCKCQDMSIVEAYNASDLVLRGTVLSIERVSVLSTINREKLIEHPLQLNIGSAFDTTILVHPLIYRIKLSVQAVFKGSNSGDTVIVYTPVSGASCGVTYFRTGEQFLLYASQKSFYLDFFIKNYKVYSHIEQPHTFWTSQCSRTNNFTEEEAAVLMKLK